jgi:phage repressor protein C with HTH and peptisase S24 domain
MPLSHSQIWSGLDAVARREGLSASGLARRAGLDPTAFNPSKRHGPPPAARPRWPSTESLAAVLGVTGLSLTEFAALARDPGPAPTAPLLGMAQAGRDGFFDEAGLPAGDWEQTTLPVPGPTCFALRIVGDSMSPLYREGDVVIVDRAETRVRPGDRVVVRTRAGEVMAKVLERRTGRSLTLGSINPAFAPRTLALGEIDWLARILWASQ